MEKKTFLRGYSYERKVSANVCLEYVIVRKRESFGLFELSKSNNEIESLLWFLIFVQLNDQKENSNNELRFPIKNSLSICKRQNIFVMT